MSEAQKPEQHEEPAAGQGAAEQPNLGSMLSGLLGGQGGGAVAKLLPAVLGMVSSSGGIGGLLEKLKQGGLGDQAKSWVSHDASNKPVDGQQVADALGPEQVNKLAEQAGVSPQEAASGLAQVLPEAVDQLTPAGEVPDKTPKFDLGQLQQQVAKLLGGQK
jgi:uncharacterized protein YidB (DUF937 family)